MSRFSERMGFRPVREVIQLDDIDEALRIRLWNTFQSALLDNVSVYSGSIDSNDPVFQLLRSLWINHYKRPLDTLDRYWDRTYKQLRSWFFGAEWLDLYDFIEFVVRNYPVERLRIHLATIFNSALKQEMSGYRFVDLRLSPITSSGEIEAIESAIQSGDSQAPHVVHLSQALSLLADRHDPDYRNSIKESISAVEAACQLVTNEPGATLGDALKVLESHRALHPALKRAFSSLYGWTSDGGGIRHALNEGSGADQADALFMMITCSAFVNYLLGKTAGP